MKQENIGKIAWLIAIAAVLVVCIFSGSCKKDSPASPNHKEVEGAPRGVTVMCIGEHEYYYSKDYSIHSRIQRPNLVWNTDIE